MRSLPKIILAFVALAPSIAFAATDADVERYRSMGMAAGFVGVTALLMISFAAFIIGFLVFWVVMLIDCLKREFPEKGSWTAILILSLFMGLHWLSAILYYVLVKQKNLGTLPKR